MGLKKSFLLIAILFLAVLFAACAGTYAQDYSLGAEAEYEEYEEYEPVQEIWYTPGAAAQRTSREAEPVTSYWPDFQLYIDARSITPYGLRLQMINNSNELYFGHGSEFRLEKYTENGWEQPPFIIDNWGWIGMLFITQPNSIREDDIEWAWLHGEMPPGEYRIVRNFMQMQDPSSFGGNSANLYVTFTIEENWQEDYALWQAEQDQLAAVAYGRFDGLDLQILEYSAKGLSFVLTNNSTYYNYIIRGIWVGWNDVVDGLGGAGATEYNIMDFNTDILLFYGESISMETDWYEAIGELQSSMPRLIDNPYIFELAVSVYLNVDDDYIAQNFYRITPGLPTRWHVIGQSFDISQ